MFSVAHFVKLVQVQQHVHHGKELPPVHPVPQINIWHLIPQPLFIVVIIVKLDVLHVFLQMNAHHVCILQVINFI
jgi:hypothetical protein